MAPPETRWPSVRYFSRFLAPAYATGLLSGCILSMSDWVLLHTGVSSYFVLFLLLIGGAVGLPIPEDLPLILGGVLLNRGDVNLEILFVTVYIGIIIGDMMIFYVGRKFGSALRKREWFTSRVTPGRMRQIRKGLEKRTFLMIVIARHLFYLRTATFLTCGAVKVPFIKFILADAIAALISASVMLFIGYQASEYYDEAIKMLGHTKLYVLVFTLLLIGGYFIYTKTKRNEEETDSNGNPVTDPQPPLQ